MLTGHINWNYSFFLRFHGHTEITGNKRPMGWARLRTRAKRMGLQTEWTSLALSKQQLLGHFRDFIANMALPSNPLRVRKSECTSGSTSNQMRDSKWTTFTLSVSQARLWISLLVLWIFFLHTHTRVCTCTHTHTSTCFLPLKFLCSQGKGTLEKSVPVLFSPLRNLMFYFLDFSVLPFLLFKGCAWVMFYICD